MTPEERAEVERLRAQVAEVMAQASADLDLYLDVLQRRADMARKQEAEVARLRALVARLAGVLREVAWGCGDPAEARRCVACQRTAYPEEGERHFDGCIVAAALAEVGER